MPVPPVTHSPQRPGTITRDANMQVSKCTKLESAMKVDTGKMHPAVQRRSKPDVTKPTESDLVKVPASPAAVSKPCNAIPTALVKLEANIKEHPHTRSDSVKSTDSKKIQPKSDVFKQCNPSLDVKGKQYYYRPDEEVAQGKIC